MRKAVPDAMFSDAERSRLSMLRTWVLDNKVSEIEMNENQFWNFAQLQPPAEKPWATFMGRLISVPDMPIDAQKQLGFTTGARSARSDPDAASWPGLSRPSMSVRRLRLKTYNNTNGDNV